MNWMLNKKSSENQWSIGLLLVWLLLSSAFVTAAEPLVLNKVYDASAYSTDKVLDDPLAFAGKGATSSRHWQPLFRAPSVKTDKNMTLWLRYRSGALCLKSQANKKQKELKWSWAKPESWTWVNFGNYSSKDLGDEILVIRDASSDQPAIDAFMFLEVGIKHPTEVQGYDEPKLPATKIDIDWKQVQGSTFPEQFGLNAFKAFDEKANMNPAYRLNMDYMNPGIIRFHSANMAQFGHDCCWMDEKKRSWDAEKIEKAMNSAEIEGKKVVITISHAPKWMKHTADGQLDVSEIDNFAKFCADLVEIVNVRLEKAIVYWEITNEWDNEYWVKVKKKNVQGLADVYLAAAQAMKAVDPSIKTGGPAVARTDKFQEQEAFALAVLPHLDFYSYHIYASGKASDSHRKILYERAEIFEKYNHKMVKMLDRVSPHQKIESHFNEYNISWTWEVRDERMTNHIGAIFDALVILGGLRAGVTASCAWNDVDGIYGKMDNQYKLRPGAHVYHLLNKYAVGRRVLSSSSSEDIESLAIDSEKHRLVMLINRSPHQHTLDVDSSSTLMGKSARVSYRISKKGFVAFPDENVLSSLRLPPESISFIVY